ncbi:MAG: SMC-Scp complex subunit ScpB [Planctomycetota bacterium]|nr:MAG: SMC-Scp complex subunit ScpB [Planctomycetota bacterium]
MTALDPASTERPAACDAGLAAHIEAILLSVDRPIAARKIVDALACAGIKTDESEVAESVDRLNQVYSDTQRSFRIESVAGGYRVMTRAVHAPVLAGLRQARSAGRLSRAALETLAIVAYEQPITRARLEAIRGVACGEVLRTLIERKLITVKGRAEELGRPMLYGTTRQFLDAFGLSSTRDLPSVEELRNAEWQGGST